MRKSAPAAALVAAAAWAGPAAAHQIVPGVTGFPSLMLHPLASADTTLCLLAAGLLIGLRGPLRPVLGAAALAAGVALGAASQLVFTGALPSLVFVVLLNLPLGLAGLGGVLVATAPRLGPVGLAAALVALAAMIGMLLLPEAPGIAGLAEAAAGALLGAVLAAALVAVPVRLVGARFGTVPARVVGSWLAAVAIFMLALSLRGAGQWQLGGPAGV